MALPLPDVQRMLNFGVSGTNFLMLCICAHAPCPRPRILILAILLLYYTSMPVPAFVCCVVGKRRVARTCKQASCTEDVIMLEFFAGGAACTQAFNNNGFTSIPNDIEYHKQMDLLSSPGFASRS